jgi:hypothetical protein
MVREFQIGKLYRYIHTVDKFKPIYRDIPGVDFYNNPIIGFLKTNDVFLLVAITSYPYIYDNRHCQIIKDDVCGWTYIDVDKVVLV